MVHFSRKSPPRRETDFSLLPSFLPYFSFTLCHTCCQVLPPGLSRSSLDSGAPYISIKSRNSLSPGYKIALSFVEVPRYFAVDQLWQFLQRRFVISPKSYFPYHVYGSAASRRPSPKKLKTRMVVITKKTGSISQG